MPNYFDEQPTLRATAGTDAVTLALQATAAAAGLALGIEILRHRKLLFVAAVGTGVAFAVRNALHKSEARAETAGATDAASYAGDYKRQASQQPSDEIDEAAMESFPASDPPASFRRSASEG